MTSDYRSYKRYSSSSSSDEEEVVLDERCCFGYMSAFTCLPVLAAINFLFDSGLTFLAIGSDFIYCFGVLAVFSLLCFASTLSGVQEESSGKIKISIGWTLIKMVLLVLLIGCSVVALTNLDWFTEITLLNVNFSICTILVVLLPLEMVLLVVQFVWSRQMLTIIAIRDMLYIIPSEIQPVPMRGSLRARLDNLKRCSIATVLEPEKY